jgi:hypothetical protein
MAKDETRILDASTLKADAEVLAAIQGMKDYAPARTELALAKLNTADSALADATTAFTQAEGAYEAARDAMVAAQWARHNVLLAAKQQVIAQYGDDSDEAQSVGLVKKSERAKPAPKKAAPAPVPAKA